MTLVMLLSYPFLIVVLAGCKIIAGAKNIIVYKINVRVNENNRLNIKNFVHSIFKGGDTVSDEKRNSRESPENVSAAKDLAGVGL